jgi:hypothetical protein
MKELIFKVKPLHSGMGCLFLSLLIALFLLPSFLFADQSTQTYDKQTIRYPSMDTGQVWVKSGATPPPPLNTGPGQIRPTVGDNSSSNLNTNTGRNTTTTGGNASPNLNRETGQVRTTPGENSSPTATQGSQITKNESAPDTEAKKRMKLRRLNALRAQENGNNQKIALHTSSPVKTGTSGTQKTSVSKSEQPRKTASSQGSGIELQKTSQAGKTWHHKQELYDVECGLKMARVVVTYYFDRRDTLLKSSISPDAEWYHIYPGSFEEKLYTDICHPR